MCRHVLASLEQAGPLNLVYPCHELKQSLLPCHILKPTRGGFVVVDFVVVVVDSDHFLDGPLAPWLLVGWLVGLLLVSMCSSGKDMQGDGCECMCY